MNVSAVIKQLRLSLGLEQGEFGNLLGVTPGTISNWENERRYPRLPKLRKMIEIAKEHKIKLSMQDFLK